MVDFFTIATRPGKRGITEIYPSFRIRNPSKHLMIRGGDFYAIWVEERGLWSVSEQDAIDIIDGELDAYARENKNKFPEGFRVLHLEDAETGMIDNWHRYCQRQMRDSYHCLDGKLIFSNTPTDRLNYASKRLPYPLEQGDISAWERLVSVLYSPEERQKIEWAIGAIVSGDSRDIQKFMVFYGAAGTGKSTILNIMEKLFEGYTCVFDAKALGSASNAFALESFKNNPLVAIQHDGDLSRLEDNTRINSVVSHELMTVNEKFKSAYANRFQCFLVMGTNKPVRITDSKSGLIRRLIDVSPTGEKLSSGEYKRLMKQIDFQLGAIAWHCLQVYEQNKECYDSYIPLSMLDATNDFYNFVMDSWPIFHRDDETTLKAAWAMYKTYCEEARVPYPYPQRAFKEELKNYFREYKEREILADGTRVRSYYRGFREEKFQEPKEEPPPMEKEPVPEWLQLTAQKSVLDEAFSDCPAQYASEKGTPMQSWEEVTTKLKDLDTGRLHYILPPGEHIVIDFDLTDENGEKSLTKNLREAAKFPPTYAEVSKSEKALHLHYIYDGDVSELSRIYAEHIEIKIFTGKSSLRRMLTTCNNLPVAHIGSGLPRKEAKKIVSLEAIQSEKGLRSMIIRNLQKEIHPNTKPSMDFIFKILEDAYTGKQLSYDVTDMRNAIIGFAAGSTNNADYCLKLVGKMHFQSEDRMQPQAGDEKPIIFLDVEVFPNLFLVNWKLQGDGKPVIRMINPKPAEIEELLQYRIIGFNCRRYDNHILYARLMGYSNLQLYNLSQQIISGGKGGRSGMFGEAYNLSYTDVYDFASAGNKKSLKKFEIELGIKHHELGLPWDKPVPEERWAEVAEYCDDDVIATEAVFNYLEADWTARNILADIAGLSVNDTTNALTTRIIFDRVKKPQEEFNYRNLAEPVKQLKKEVEDFLRNATPEMLEVTHGEEESLLPYFPGYKHIKGVSTYQEEVVGEGGYVYAQPGIHHNVALLDVASMHPHSVIAECLFGVRFTTRFKEIVDGRVSIKHQAWDEVNTILDGKLTPYIQKVKNGEMSAKQLANALKTAINSVYGLTSAAFENAFRDPRNKDNIVAKRGALFMIDLKRAVQSKGFTVAHIKTDSIKIPDATPAIISFVMAFGKQYGYTFEHEATYERMCLVNDAVYIARYASKEDCLEQYGYIPGDNREYPGQWTATGKQFAVPYVFKTLFSHEDILFKDLCEVFSVSGALYLDRNEALPNVEEAENRLTKLLKKLEMSYTDYLDFLESGALREEIGTADNAMALRELHDEIERGHNYQFVGKVGQFTPIQSGFGGGILLRCADGKYSAATGSKGYRWMESDKVEFLRCQDKIDMRYYKKLVDDAADAIRQYGDFEGFVSV